MPDYSDFIPRKRALEAEQKTKLHDQRVLQQGVGVMMTELLAEPHWQLYAEHLEALAQNAEKQCVSKRAKLTDGEFLSDQAYGQLRMEIAECAAFARAYRRALDVVKQIVETGKIAEEELAK